MKPTIKPTERPKIGIIGAGTVGTALALTLKSKGYPIVAVSSRRLVCALKLAELVDNCQAFPHNQNVVDNADLVFITTPDDTIASVAHQLKWHTRNSVVHCSGADSVDILNPAKQAGSQTGVFHPLQTFSSTSQAIRNIPGSTFALEADKPLLKILKDIVILLGGRCLIIKPEDRIKYHLAAVFASNYLVTLVKLAANFWPEKSDEKALKSLLPLIYGTINNIETAGLPECLTGPIARGDTGTIKKHLGFLKNSTPDLITVYRELGLQTVSIALAKGKINHEKAQEMKEILKG